MTAPTLMHAMLVAHELLSFALLYSCFCRGVLMSSRVTARDVRLAFYTLSLSAVLCVFAPLVLHWQPDLVSLSLLASITCVQIVTARRWRGGQPIDFVRDDL